MPLKKGTSRSAVSGNVKTLMHDYEKKGAIGKSKPASKKKAQKQAVAIALSKARESGAKIPKKKSSRSQSTGATKSKTAGSTKSAKSGKSTARKSNSSKSTAAKSTSGTTRKSGK